MAQAIHCHEMLAHDRVSHTSDFSCKELSLDAINQQVLAWTLDKFG